MDLLDFVGSRRRESESLHAALRDQPFNVGDSRMSEATRHLRHCPGLAAVLFAAAQLALSGCSRSESAEPAAAATPGPGTTTPGSASTPAAARRDGDEAATISGGELPAGYRDWRLISVAREEGGLDDIRAVLGNDAAIEAYRDGRRSFPEGTVIARLAWAYLPSEENNKAFGKAQSFVAGPPKNGVQFMVKDSNKYASTGGWGYFQFDDGKPFTDPAALRSCVDCHAAVKDRDSVFTRYAP